MSGILQTLLGGVTTEVVTWNPADKNAAITLDATKLIATCPGGAVNANVRATNSRVTQRAFQVAVGSAAGGYPAVGLANATASLGGVGQYLGFDNNSVGYFADGSIYRGGAVITTLATYTSGDTITVEMDRSSGNNVYFRKNGGARSAAIDLSAITGALFPALTEFNATDSVTANFGATVFSGTVTYLPWNVVE